ncbi:dihydrolipoyllysine-residue acetyltransferase [Legionella sp. CNM-4043-24]|uniref:dihydrolipoyllysine-residue acetyltransferase n=1 Tax=Legionella sp. CNM-4043-24 TaxID=3421646 RepID=UPI00403ADA8E
MADEIKITVPDIGGASQVDVIELLVKPGDTVQVDTPLIMLESDKASMEIPSPFAGTVVALSVKTGDKVSEGDLILTLAQEAASQAPVESKTPEQPVADKKEETLVAIPAPTATQSQSVDVCIPDIGGATDVDVIEIMVKAGDSVEKDQALVTLEGDKATMDIPSPMAGKVQRVLINIGDKVAQGSMILVLDTEQSTEIETKPEAPVKAAGPVDAPVARTETVERIVADITENVNAAMIQAGPSVRRLAREFGVDLSQVKGTGRKSRITTEDVQAWVKARLSEKPAAAGGFAMPQAPVIDFSKFGPVDIRPLNKIKRLTGVNVHRSWITIPHVTQFDEADITELEAFRKSESEAAAQAGYKLTVLAFVTKVVALALKKFPQFNSSLDASGENLIYKNFVNIGIAVETPDGLVVPVIKQVDQLSIGGIAMEMARLSKKAREKTMTPADMSGGCFTISSLGGIGGTAFTPIVNSPEVAILGLSRSSIKPVYDQKEFKPRLMLPLSLSYDHRVIDGAEAARFTRYIADLLADIRRIIL